VLRRIYGPRRDKLTREWKNLHDEKVNDLYCSPNIVRVIKLRIMRWAWPVACKGERSGKPEGRRPLERHRLRWEDNI
jgi:hypothetical protein